MKYQFSNHGRQPTVCSRVEVGSGEACSRRNDRYRSYNLIHNETTPTGDAASARGRTSVERGSQLWMLTVSNNKFDIKSKSK